MAIVSERLAVMAIVDLRGAMMAIVAARGSARPTGIGAPETADRGRRIAIIRRRRGPHPRALPWYHGAPGTGLAIIPGLAARNLARSGDIPRRPFFFRCYFANFPGRAPENVQVWPGSLVHFPRGANIPLDPHPGAPRGAPARRPGAYRPGKVAGDPCACLLWKLNSKEGNKMAQKRSDASDAALAVTEKPAPAATAALPVEVRPDSGDPDRVVATQSVGDVVVDIRQKDAQRGAGAALRSELRSMVRAQRLAAAVADRLCSFTEVAELPAKVLDVKIELRRRGDLPLIKGDGAK